MWAAVKQETGGRLQVQTFLENDQLAGGDPLALAMVIDGRLDFLTLNGGLIGSWCPRRMCRESPSPSKNFHASSPRWTAT